MPEQSHRTTTGRRAYDGVTAEIALAIEDGLRDNRHALRDDITAMKAHVEAGQLQSTKEHAEVRADIKDLQTDVRELKIDVRELRTDLSTQSERVADLETNDKIDQARDETHRELLAQLQSNRRWMIGTITAVAALAVSATSTVIAVLT